MSTTLTIRNLDQEIKQQLRVRAATHGCSMEAEARKILTDVFKKNRSEKTPKKIVLKKIPNPQFAHLIGIWKGRMKTDEIMKITRGE